MQQKANEVVDIGVSGTTKMETEELPAQPQGEQDSLNGPAEKKGPGPSREDLESAGVSTIHVPWKETSPEKEALSEEKPGSSTPSERVNSERDEVDSDGDIPRKGESWRKHIAEKKSSVKTRKKPPTTRQKARARLDSALKTNKETTSKKKKKLVLLKNLSKLRDEEEVIFVSDKEEEEEHTPLVRKNSKGKGKTVASEEQSRHKEIKRSKASEDEQEELVTKGKKGPSSSKKRTSTGNEDRFHKEKEDQCDKGTWYFKKGKQQQANVQTEEILEEGRPFNIRGKKVLMGRVIAPEISEHQALNDLMEVLKFQQWEHLMVGPLVVYE
ncbi:uncharacterized protein LOC132609125 [Lycium barbarum]|uniref:uncharacterized protein LOC132609125 n=1 Tax=Lycium barbarum TaxID=112863 RepID=UPI00293F202F|nr:uncharacterized protein LOC132609125 [Lycium barbarum]